MRKGCILIDFSCVEQAGIIPRYFLFEKQKIILNSLDVLKLNSLLYR